MPDNTDPKPRTIDERLDRLTERHEALTQSVELLLAAQHDRDEKWNKRFEEDERKWNKRFAEVAESIASLAHIAEIHEHRISGLEDQQ